MTNKPFGTEELSITGDSNATPQIQSADDLFLRLTGEKTVIIGSENADFASPAPAEVVSTNVARLNVGIVTANKYYGDGSELDGISVLQVTNKANNRVITATGNNDELNAEANLTFDGSVLTASHTITSFVDTTKTDNYTIVSGDRGKYIRMTVASKEFRIDSSTGFSTGDTVVLFNGSTSPMTLGQLGSANLYLGGTSSAGNRTLSVNCIATVFCDSSNNYIVSGQGVS